MKQVLISGATGSLGQALTRKLLSLKKGPERIVCYSRGEHAQEAMERALGDGRMRYFIGDIRDQRRLELALRGIDTVFHTAALKVVPKCETDPTECIATNVDGAVNLMHACINMGVKHVVGISTDKCVNPINVYGASKLCMEKVLIAGNNLTRGLPAISVCRYGNVWGSRGSVVPLFKGLVASGLPLTITSPEMTRFSITLEQAVDFILGCYKIMQGREIFIPKIPSYKVSDLAEAVSPCGEHILSGIRPGEKMHEVLLTEDESMNAYMEESHYTIAPPDYLAGRWKDNGSVGYALPKVPKGFRYSSDTNERWLGIAELREMI